MNSPVSHTNSILPSSPDCKIVEKKGAKMPHHEDNNFSAPPEEYEFAALVHEDAADSFDKRLTTDAAFRYGWYDL